MSEIFESASSDRKAVFLVTNKAPNLDTPTLFKEKGLAPFAPERPGYLEYFGGRRVVGLGRQLYVANIAAIMYASYYGQACPATYNFFSLLGITLFAGFIEAPTVAVSYSSTPNLEIKNQFSSLGFSQQEHRNMIQFYGKITARNSSDIMETHPNIDCSTPVQATNIRGYMAFNTTVRLVQQFLRTNLDFGGRQIMGIEDSPMWLT